MRVREGREPQEKERRRGLRPISDPPPCSVRLIIIRGKAVSARLSRPAEASKIAPSGPAHSSAPAIIEIDILLTAEP